jgi:hypothetical protein
MEEGTPLLDKHVPTNAQSRMEAHSLLGNGTENTFHDKDFIIFTIHYT